MYAERLNLILNLILNPPPATVRHSETQSKIRIKIKNEALR